MPNPLGTEPFPTSAGYWASGLRNMRGTLMTPLAPGEAILTVAIMSLTVLIDIALFASIEMF